MAAREAFWAAQEAAETEAAAGKATGKAAAETTALPTTALDPPAQQSVPTAPAAAPPNAARAAASKPQAKPPAVAATAASQLTGDNSTLGPQVSNSRPAAGDAQKAGLALAPSCASLTDDKQGAKRHAATPAGDEDNDDSSYLPDEVAAPAATSRRLKRLRKQPPSAGINKKKPAAEHALEEDEAAVAQNAAAHVAPSQGSGLSLEQPVSTGDPAHIEVFVDAVGPSLEQADAGCARARPWLKHLQQAAEEAQAAAVEAAKHSEAIITPTAVPAPAPAAAKDSTAVAANQHSVGQVGSGGSDAAAVAGPPGAKETTHTRGRPKQGRLAPAEAQQQPQQQDQHSQAQREHAPRGSRTSPHSPPTLPTVQPKQADSRTGTSQPRGGTSLPTKTPSSRNANPTHNRQPHQADDISQEAQASPSDGARSGESSDDASVQHGVGHTGESSEALPASMRSSKPEVQVQRQQQQQPPTSSISEQGLHSAAGNAKPGAAPPAPLALLM